MAKIYVSHNREDHVVIAGVVGLLKKRAHTLLIDTELLGEGSDWREIMHGALRSAEVFVVFISDAAMRSSFVLSELGAARYRRENEGLLMIPVIIDPMQTPRVIQDLTAIHQTERNVTDIVDKIETLITRQRSSRPEIQLFISHAHRDVGIAQKLVTAFELGMDVPVGSIRCTSVPGYKLDLGSMPSDALAREMTAAKCVLALVTPHSLASQWVLFELGATWGFAKSWLPVLAGGLQEDGLPGPFRGAAAAQLSDPVALISCRDHIRRILEWTERNTAASNGQLTTIATEAAVMSFAGDEVERELKSSFAAKRARIGRMQGEILDYVSSRDGKHAAVTLAELVGKFHLDESQIYYRLEQLRYLGFLARKPSVPPYAWALSESYQTEIGR